MTEWDEAYQNLTTSNAEREEQRQDELSGWIGRLTVLVAIAAAIVWVVL